MAFQWLEMRITEERERRQREAAMLKQLPRGLEELYRVLAECVAEYTKAFGAQSAEITLQQGRICITMRALEGTKWEPHAQLDITGSFDPPAFKIDRGAESFLIDVGLLPGEKLFYREGDDYLTVEELTKRILDPALFPKLSA